MIVETMIFIAYAHGMPESENWAPIESVGATGRTVARNIHRLRGATTYKELASRLERHGRPIPTLGLRKIESGGRRVDTDDLLAIAAVLGVSPATLLMPATNDDGAEVNTSDVVSITGWSKPISARPVWDWLIAAKPLVRGTSMAGFVQRSWPVWERRRFDEAVRKALGGMSEQDFADEAREELENELWPNNGNTDGNNQ